MSHDLELRLDFFVEYFTPEGVAAHVRPLTSPRSRGPGPSPYGGHSNRSRRTTRSKRLEPRTLFAAGDLDPSFGLGGSVFVDVSPVANDSEGDQAPAPSR